MIVQHGKFEKYRALSIKHQVSSFKQNAKKHIQTESKSTRRILLSPAAKPKSHRNCAHFVIAKLMLAQCQQYGSIVNVKENCIKSEHSEAHHILLCYVLMLHYNFRLSWEFFLPETKLMECNNRQYTYTNTHTHALCISMLDEQ